MPLPLIVIGVQMGANPDDIWRIKAWTDAWVQRLGLMQTPEEVVWSTEMEIEAQHYFQPIFERLRAEPDDTLLSDLVNTPIPEWGRCLTDEELHAEMMADTFVGGSETTTNALSGGVRLLIEHPDQWDRLKSDPDTYLPALVEEVLRLESPVQRLTRTAAVDVELHGVTIPAGTSVLIGYAAANRDDRVFERARPVRPRSGRRQEARHVRLRHPLLPGCAAGAPGAVLRVRGAGPTHRRDVVPPRHRSDDRPELLPAGAEGTADRVPCRRTGTCVTNPFDAARTATIDLDETGGARATFDHMPIGQAVDMGHADDGTPLVDPRIFDSSEFRRNPYPYYRILRDHYPVFHDRLHNCYYVTRYRDIAACYFDEVGFNTIPKGSSSGVLGNTQLELSGIEHRRRRNIYGRHLVGAALTKRLPALRRLAQELIEQWWLPDNPKGVEFDEGSSGHRTRPVFRQRVPDQRGRSGARHPPGRPPTVHLVVRRDDVRARRQRHPPRRPRRPRGSRALRGVAGGAAADGLRRTCTTRPGGRSAWTSSPSCVMPRSTAT